MKCPHCGAAAVIDSDSFGRPARLCARCNRVWAIDPSEVQTAPTPGRTAPPRRKRGRWTWCARLGAGRDEK
jgi:predicted Zn finger-like uncharacterized protein